MICSVIVLLQPLLGAGNLGAGNDINTDCRERPLAMRVYEYEFGLNYKWNETAPQPVAEEKNMATSFYRLEHFL